MSRRNATGEHLEGQLHRIEALKPEVKKVYQDLVDLRRQMLDAIESKIDMARAKNTQPSFVIVHRFADRPFLIEMDQVIEDILNTGDLPQTDINQLKLKWRAAYEKLIGRM